MMTYNIVPYPFHGSDVHTCYDGFFSQALNKFWPDARSWRYRWLMHVSAETEIVTKLHHLVALCIQSGLVYSNQIQCRNSQDYI